MYHADDSGLIKHGTRKTSRQFEKLISVPYSSPVSSYEPASFLPLKACGGVRGTFPKILRSGNSDHVDIIDEKSLPTIKELTAVYPPREAASLWDQQPLFALHDTHYIRLEN